MSAAMHMHTLPFQASIKPCANRCAAPRRSLLTRAEANNEAAWTRTAGVSLLAAGLAATVMLNMPAPAMAGVVRVEPSMKRQRAFQKREQVAEDQVQQESPSQSGGGGGFSLPSLPAPSLPTSFPFPALPDIDTKGGIDPRSVALPGALAAIAAAGYAAYSLDGGFRSMIRESLVKDSTGYAGYEETIKGDPASTQYVGPAVKGTKKIGFKNPPVQKKSVKGTKKTVKGKKGGTEEKKGGLFGLFS